MVNSETIGEDMLESNSWAVYLARFYATDTADDPEKYEIEMEQCGGTVISHRYIQRVFL